MSEEEVKVGSLEDKLSDEEQQQEDKVWEELEELLEGEGEYNKGLILVIQKDGNLLALLDTEEEYTDEQMAMFARVYMLKNPSWVLWVVLFIEIWFTEAMLLWEEKKPVLLDKWKTLKDEGVRLMVLLGAYWSSLCVWARVVWARVVAVKARLRRRGLDKKWEWVKKQLGKVVGSLFEK